MSESGGWLPSIHFSRIRDAVPASIIMYIEAQGGFPYRRFCLVDQREYRKWTAMDPYPGRYICLKNARDWQVINLKLFSIILIWR